MKDQNIVKGNKILYWLVN